jgi:hypothetical protein
MMNVMSPKTLHPPWPPAVVQGVADVLAGIGWPGFTNTEITQLLAILGLSDVEAPNERTRLWAALHNQQLRDQASNCVTRFITEAMAPGRHLQDQPRFEALRDALAEPLALVGLRVNEQGKLARGARPQRHSTRWPNWRAGSAPSCAAAEEHQIRTARRCSGGPSHDASRPDQGKPRTGSQVTQVTSQDFGFHYNTSSTAIG